MQERANHPLIAFPRGPLTGAFLLTLLSVIYLGVLVYETPKTLNKLRYEQKEFMLLRGQILQFDEVLTMSAKMAAATGDAYWYERYSSYEPRLDVAIQRAKALAASDEASVRAASQTDEANRILVSLELKAFDAVKLGNRSEAVSILNQPLYNDNKAVYTSGMTGFLEAADHYLSKSIEHANNQARIGTAIASLIGILVLGSWCWVLLLIRGWQLTLEGTQVELTEANTFLQMAADSAGVGPWRFFSAGSHLELSSSCLEVLGYSQRGAPSARDVLRSVSADDRRRLFEAIRRAKTQKSHASFDLELSLGSGDTPKWVTCTGKLETAGLQSKNPIWHLTGTIHDITNRRKAEAVLVKVNEVVAEGAAAQLRKSEQQADALRGFALELSLAEQKERLRVSHLLHDNLQQSLVSARFKLASIRMDVEAPVVSEMDDLDHTLSTCIDSARTLSGDLNPPLLFERGFLAVCYWMVAWMKEKYELNVHLEVDDEMEPPSQEVKILLFQCLRELLFNVVKHAETRDAHVKIGCSVAGQTEVEVTDHGVGFDSHSVLAEGVPTTLGLGLSDVRARVEASGGVLEVDSKRDEGTSVFLRVPNQSPDTVSILTAAIESLAESQDVRDVASFPEEGTRILVVDHHSDFRRGLLRVLEREEGFVVVGSTGEGETAIQMAEELRPDIIILDSALPRMPVVQVAREILSRHPCQILGLSIPAPGEISESMIAAGVVSYVTKGAPVAHLFSELRSMVRAG